MPILYLYMLQGTCLCISLYKDCKVKAKRLELFSPHVQILEYKRIWVEPRNSPKRLPRRLENDRKQAFFGVFQALLARWVFENLRQFGAAQSFWIWKSELTYRAVDRIDNDGRFDIMSAKRVCLPLSLYKRSSPFYILLTLNSFNTFRGFFAENKDSSEKNKTKRELKEKKKLKRWRDVCRTLSQCTLR